MDSFPSERSAVRRFGAWLLTGAGISALIAALLGAVTVVLLTFARPGWPRLDTALLLGLAWVLWLGLWLIAVSVRASARPPIVWRQWLVTPVIVFVAFVLSVGGVVASNYVRGTTASLSVEASIDGTRLQLSGWTDLPDGARLWVGAYHEESWRIATGKEVVVTRGRYEAVFVLDRWPNGTIVASASFEVYSGQPAAVIERFGREGEHLHGPQVRHDSDGPVLEAVTRVEVTEGLPPDHPDALRPPVTVYGMVLGKRANRSSKRR
ncbi:MAG: hypothetical protein M3N29_01430 [Chloroflexota bacterium]|nr:hypothetical protein [Chloroflexota bacterium]